MAQEQQTTVKPLVLVEDDEDIRALLLRVFRMEVEYEVLVLESDREAISRLAEIRSLKPVIFLLNYRLPQMTGLELYDFLHKQPGLEHVPAILMSAFQPTRTLQRKLHARDIILVEKPFDLEDFLCFIEQTLLSHQSALTDIRPLFPEQAEE